jgi:phenylpropionate dioxygenase-like ring-hydroxylating dioxygenase large terminal subunit
MPGRVRAKVYPTVTLKGVVFVWMGSGKPAPLPESIPQEFHDANTVVLNWLTSWPCNWRLALEKVADSHFRYVHKNSVLQLMRPLAGPSRSHPRSPGPHRQPLTADARRDGRGPGAGQ